MGKKNGIRPGKILRKRQARLTARKNACMAARQAACNRNGKLRENIDKAFRMSGALK